VPQRSSPIASQFALLEQHSIGNRDLADVVEKRAAMERVELVLIQLQMPAEHRGVVGQTLAVPLGARIAGFDDPPEREEERFSGLEIVGQPLEPHQRTDTRLQLLGIDRLVEEVVGAGVEAGESGLALLRAADQHHRREAGGGVPFDLDADVQPGDAGHEHVEQHEVGPLAPDDLERVAAVGRGQHGVVGSFEQLSQPTQVGRVIVDDQHLSGFRHRAPHPQTRGPVELQRPDPRVFQRQSKEKSGSNMGGLTTAGTDTTEL
jgi:hypothetical protein